MSQAPENLGETPVFAPKIHPQEVGAMSKGQLASELARHYPDAPEGECVAYLEGGRMAAAMLGLDDPTCQAFLSEWSRFDERMYLGSLFVALHQKPESLADQMGVSSRLQIVN